MKYLLALCALAMTMNVLAQSDDYSTPGINEGKIGSGHDDYSTPDINEGKVGSGQDDYSTPDINEGKIDWD